MTPPLLDKMLETKVGDLVVRRDRIIEPLTGCRVASGFPTSNAAEQAAKEMNAVADWPGIIKCRAEDRLPNCINELDRIAQKHGGQLGRGANENTVAACARAAAALDRR